MTIQRSILFALIATLMCALVCSQALGSDSTSTVTTVSLKSTVRLAQEDETLTIGDLAVITGPQAKALEALTIETTKPIASGQWTEIKIGTLRELVEQSSVINAGSVVFVGTDISITRRRESAVSVPNLPSTSFKANTYEGPILQDHIEQWIYTRLRTQADATRLKFEKRDTKLLNTPTGERVVEITETGRSGKVHLRVAIYAGDRIIADTTLRVGVELQRSVRVATRQIRRREVIDTNMCIVEMRWLSPVLAIADPKASLGLESKTTINPGEIILGSMLTQRILVKRGQLVSAKSLVGQAIVTKTVRALESGQMGDLIELESKDHKSHFTARIAGPGRVVIVEPSKSVASSN